MYNGFMPPHNYTSGLSNNPLISHKVQLKPHPPNTGHGPRSFSATPVRLLIYWYGILIGDYFSCACRFWPLIWSVDDTTMITAWLQLITFTPLLVQRCNDFMNYLAMKLLGYHPAWKMCHYRWKLLIWANLKCHVNMSFHSIAIFMS